MYGLPIALAASAAGHAYGSITDTMKVLKIEENI
jgi:hypothetical protein